MTKVKKLVGVVTTSVILMFSVTGCGGGKQVTGDCDLCGNTAPLYTYNVTLEGQKETGHVCEDCLNNMKLGVDVYKAQGVSISFSSKKYVK